MWFVFSETSDSRMDPEIKDLPHDRIASGDSFSEGIFPIIVTVVTTVLLIAGGSLYWYYSSQMPDFAEVYVQLGIRPLPATIERKPPIQSRLAQLAREACYKDAVLGLAKALLEAGYPRESATSLRSFVARCGSAQEILPLAYQGLEKINDFSAALDIAKELVDAAPAIAVFRYWRAIAYDQTGNFALALTDYMNTIQLAGASKNVSAEVFYKLSRMYAALARFCDAITPIEMYIALDPANRRTPQTARIIADYAEKGNCDKRYAKGAARVPLAGTADVRTLTVTVNGVSGNLILDTGATFVSITPQFAAKAKISTEPGNQLSMKTAGGRVLAEIGYANSVGVGKAEASGVVVAVHRAADNPFGDGIDGLLGMSFLSRFNVTLSPSAIDLKAAVLR